MYLCCKKLNVNIIEEMIAKILYNNFMVGDEMYFEYGEKEIEYLKSCDKLLGDVIDKIGKGEGSG